jgi:hypothetical protein
MIKSGIDSGDSMIECCSKIGWLLMIVMVKVLFKKRFVVDDCGGENLCPVVSALTKS